MSNLRGSDARALARKLNSQAVMVLEIDKAGQAAAVVYAHEEKKYHAMTRWVSGVLRFNLSKIPFQTVFGYGTGGKPTPLTAAEFDELPIEGRIFATEFDGCPEERLGWQSIQGDTADLDAAAESLS